MKNLVLLLSFVFVFVTNTFAQTVAKIPVIQIISTSTPHNFKSKAINSKDKLMVEEYLNKEKKKAYRLMIICKDEQDAKKKRLYYSKEFSDCYITMRTQDQINKMFPFSFEFALIEKGTPCPDVTPQMYMVPDHTLISMSDAEFILNTLFYKFEDRNGIKSHKQGIHVDELPYYIFTALDLYMYYLNGTSESITSTAIEEVIFAWMGDMNN
jgi:hypothetical protein